MRSPVLEPHDHPYLKTILMARVRLPICNCFVALCKELYRGSMHVASTRLGTPLDALADPPFRRVFFGAFASSIGTWMQNVALLLFAYQLTADASFVGAITFAQLGPMLFMTPLGGIVADRSRHKTILIVANLVQGLLSGCLAWLVLSEHTTKLGLLAIVAGIGSAGAFASPAAQAALPHLARPENLGGAIAVNSASLNLSRVIGPILSAVPWLRSPALVFGVNAATYLFAIAAIGSVKFPPRNTTSDQGSNRIREGFVIVIRHRRIRAILVTVAMYSFGSLAFIYHMVGFSESQLGTTPAQYRWLFASFGTGAALGAILTGFLGRRFPPERTVGAALLAFAISLSGFALYRGSILLSAALVAAAGLTYFVAITSLSTMLQRLLDARIRGRVMSLWMMAWAGMVPVGSLVAGIAIDHSEYQTVFLGGAVIAVGCAVPWFRTPETN